MHSPPPLHTRQPLRRTWPNRIFAVIYACTLATLLHHETTTLFHTTTTSNLILLLANLLFSFMWLTYQGFRMNPVSRKTFPENLPKNESKYPAMDVFICTADPEKEPPMVAVNTALSMLAYDYPPEKLSVYLSDDGGSRVTLLAFMEAAKFAKHWLPYCKKNGVMERCPQAHFDSNSACFPETHQIKALYESIKIKVEKAIGGKEVYPEDDIFSHWNDDNFTRQDHPTIIKVLLNATKDVDMLGCIMPNLIYVSREKRKTTPHHFKAGALNVLIRVSEIMTNAPIILIMDCDMYSNDPKTPLKALCYFLDPSKDSNIAYLQFPQLFHGINRDDLYGAEFKFIFQVDMRGTDGLAGPVHCGTGAFFRRKAFYENPSSTIINDAPNKLIQSDLMLLQAHEVASCNFETQTKWGIELGYRYGSLVEDFYTGYCLQCQGWRSAFELPKRPAFLGNAPMNLDDLLNQTKRWSMGLLDVAFCAYSPLNHGFKLLPIFHTLCYTHYIFWPIWCIPLSIYALLPQLALINSFTIFPKVSDPWFLVYGFLFIGAYSQDYLDFKLAGGTTKGWYNNQRMWMVRGVSSYTFGLIEYTLVKLGLLSSGFNVTSKVVDKKANARYEKGIMEFGVVSPYFYPISVVALINLIAFINGFIRVFKYGGFQELFMQISIACFVVINSWPVYEAMIFRSDNGKMPLKVTLWSIALAMMLYIVSPLAF